jgi:hypothetical protein
MGRGATSTGAVRVETNFRLMSGTIGQPPATARCKGTALPTAFNFAVRIEQSAASKSA